MPDKQQSQQVHDVQVPADLTPRKPDGNEASCACCMARQRVQPDNPQPERPEPPTVNQIGVLVVWPKKPSKPDKPWWVQLLVTLLLIIGVLIVIRWTLDAGKGIEAQGSNGKVTGRLSIK